MFQKRSRPSLGKMDSDRLSRAVVTLVELVARLRGPGGCPWDAKQTDSSIKTYLLEEAYEVIEAIEKLSPKDVCQELGDLLFQILFLAQMAAERKEFDFTEVVERITEKMKHRHPHVFGEAKVDNEEDVALNWARIKKEEGGISREASSALESVPMVLPALLRAHRLSERAAKIGFDWPNAGECWGKIREEFEAVGEAVVKGDKDQFARETGDFLFALVNLARHWGFNAEHMLRLANERFSERFKKMEKELKASGVELEKATPEQMSQAWERVG